MSTRVDPLFLEKMHDFGAFDINACFNCGNCSAVCPLSSENDSFPRKMIRYAQIGDRDRLLGCKELWLCYYCGECSDTCPREAEPGEFMASARRYAIASLDPTGISRLLYTSRFFTAVFLTVITALFSLVFIAMRGATAPGPPDLFGFLSFEIIHDVGLAVIGVALLAAAAGIIRMIRQLSRAVPPAPDEGKRTRKDFLKKLVPAVKNVIAELTVEQRYRDCEDTETGIPWYRNRWFIHWTIMWGFIGLLAATGLDYVWLIFGDKLPGQPDPLWWPNRLLGNIAGILLIYGTTLTIISRLRKPDKYSSHSLLSDWLFIWLLFLTGLTGFVVELTAYLPEGASWIYIVFLIHVVLGMEIVFLLPFTKFAHSLYRPLALLIYNFNRPSGQPV